MKTPEFIKKIDWSELRNQKRSLIEVIDYIKTHNPYFYNDLNGILHLIDALQDYAVDDAKIIDSMHVYDFELEEERETKTPTKRTDYVCAHCNSNNVQVKGWIKCNENNQVVDFVHENEIGSCNDCRLHSIIETKEVNSGTDVIGFQVVGEKGTKEEGKTHPHMDSITSIYNLTQAKSMLDDKNDDEEQWQLLAVWTDDIKNPFWMFDDNPRD